MLNTVEHFKWTKVTLWTTSLYYVTLSIGDKVRIEKHAQLLFLLWKNLLYVYRIIIFSSCSPLPPLSTQQFQLIKYQLVKVKLIKYSNSQPALLRSEGPLTEPDAVIKWQENMFLVNIVIFRRYLIIMWHMHAIVIRYVLTVIFLDLIPMIMCTTPPLQMTPSQYLIICFSNLGLKGWR